MLGYNDYDFLTSQEWWDALKNKNKDVIKKGQEILGFTGKDVDGIAGPATADAYNKVRAEADPLYGRVWRAQFIPNEKANQLHQDFNDAQVYGFNQDEAENELNQEIRQEKIAKLESQIAMVKERIERNKRALVGKSYEDVNKKLAQLDMKKIGLRLNHNNANTDPTNLWRWNQGRLDTKEANAKVDGRALQKWGYEIQPTLQQEINPYNYQEQREQLKNIRTLLANGRALGASKEQLMPLLEKEAELTDLVSSTFKNEATSRKIKSQMGEYDKQLQQGTLKAAEYRDKIQDLLDNLPEGYDEIRQELETKLKFGNKKATPSAIPQV